MRVSSYFAGGRSRTSNVAAARAALGIIWEADPTWHTATSMVYRRSTGGKSQKGLCRRLPYMHFKELMEPPGVTVRSFFYSSKTFGSYFRTIIALNFYIFKVFQKRFRNLFYLTPRLENCKNMHFLSLGSILTFSSLNSIIKNFQKGFKD